MVQYTSRNNDAYDEAKDYWKLESYNNFSHGEQIQEFKRRGYYCVGKNSIVKLPRMLSRLDRGSLLYENCSVGELEDFCEARGISIKDVDRESSKWDMEILLQAADETATFRFSDMPAELRVNVYEKYFEGLDVDLEALTQPPITEVSKLIRQEALPLFYQTCTFKLNIQMSMDWDPTDPDTLPVSTAELRTKPQLFWDALPEQHLRYIRKLHIANVHNRSGGKGYHVEFGAKEDEVQVNYVGRVTGVADEDEELPSVALAEDLQRTLKEMRLDGNGLQDGDIDEIVRFFSGFRW